MAGWIVRVVTVRTRSSAYRTAATAAWLERDITERRPTTEDAGVGFELPAGGRAGPCGSLAGRSAEPVFRRLVDELLEYVARWGHDPIGSGARLGYGAKVGKRGWGDNQDYLFNHK